MTLVGDFRLGHFRLRYFVLERWLEKFRLGPKVWETWLLNRGNWLMDPEGPLGENGRKSALDLFQPREQGLQPKDKRNTTMAKIVFCLMLC